jgi:phosphopantothenoylcysteine decarboxylase
MYICPSHNNGKCGLSQSSSHSIRITFGAYLFQSRYPTLANVFQYNKVQVEVVATKASLEFYDHKRVEAAGSRVWLDQDEWQVGSLLFSPN